MSETSYTGWKKWIPTNDEWVSFALDHTAPFKMLENEYLLVYGEDGILAEQFVMKQGKLEKIGKSSIKLEKQPETEFNTENGKKRPTPKRRNCETYIPRNDEQICAFDMIKDPATSIKLLTGHWGTGKSMILVAAALEALAQGKFEKIIWIRNNVDVAGTKDLGALPGEILDKLLPFLGPFIDHCGKEKVKTMINKETLVVEPLQSLRGRNFKNSLIMCSEIENLTKEHLQLIIARAAEGSQVWLDGDNRQRDKAIFEKSQGIETMIEKFKGNPLFGYVHLVKSERSETAAMADLLD